MTIRYHLTCYNDYLLQRLNDTINYYQQPEAVQAKLLSKPGKGIINHGLGVSFERANLFQQVPESIHGCASIYGTGFATSIRKVLVPIHGFRFKTLTEDAYEELYNVNIKEGSGML